MVRTRVVVALAVVLASAVAVAAASAALTAAPPKPKSVKFVGAKPGSGKGVTLGYISLGESVPFVRLVSNSIRAQAKRAGARLIFCDSAIDASKALDCAKNFKTQGVDGYLNFQVFQNAAANICKAGPQVPVISIDIHQQPCERSFMGANNEYAGWIAGEAVGKLFKSRFNCEYDAFVTLESAAAGVVNDQRVGGIVRGFESVCGKVENRRRLDGADRIDPARTKFADALTALPGADRIIVAGLNDDGVLGALAAARTAGREDALWVTGQGADPSAWCAILENDQWVADAAYFPERYGEIGVPYLIDLVKGKKAPKELLVPHTIINSKNIKRFYKVTGC
jgi:ribose transport system substrate-binding protein